MLAGETGLRPQSSEAKITPTFGPGAFLSPDTLACRVDAARIPAPYLHDPYADVALPLYATGERALCQRCERTGYRRRRLGVTRSPGLVACRYCWRAHERAGVWPTAERPHDPDECRLCTPWTTPDDGEDLVDVAGERVPLQVHCDQLVADRRQAEREAQRWREQATRTREAIAAGRPVLLVAAALHLQERARTSLRGRPSLGGHVAAVMAVSGERGSGNRARPGREQTAELVGISEQAVTAHWRRLEALGWCTRTVKGGALPFRERILERRSNSRTEFRIALPHRLLGAEAGSARLAEPAALMERAVAVLVELAERAEELAAVARVRAESTAAELAALGRSPAELHPCNFLLPPGGVKGSTEGSGYRGLALPARIVIARWTRGTGRPAGRGGATRRAATGAGARSHRVGRPRTARSACQATLELARALCAADGPIIAVRRAPVVRVAAVLRRFGQAGWTLADVLAAAETRLAARGAGRTWTPPDRAERPAAWLRWLLADADPATPPVQVARASQFEHAAQVRAAAELARSEAASRSANRSANPGAAAEARAAAEQARRYATQLRNAGDEREAARRAAIVRAALDSW